MPTTASSSESSSTGESETDTDGDEPEYCVQACDEDADCCPDGVPDCPGAFPWNVSCVDGLCEYGGCASDADCGLVGITCEDLGDFAGCVSLCDDDDDCDGGATCTGVTEDGQHHCLYVFLCTSDDDCQGFGVCDVDTGACICESDDVCPDGWACATLP